MNKYIATIAALVLVFLMIWVSWDADHVLPLVAWAIVAVSMIAFMLILGGLVTKHPFGILVNERNLMSLSRFQMVLWTVIILSAYLVIVIGRIRNGTPDAVNVVIDWHLLALLGISTTSLIGSPLIGGAKANQEAQSP